MPKALKFLTGYTLIELILVMLVSSILCFVVAIFIVRPIAMYRNIVARSTLLEVADQAMRRMARDIHKAVPNSLRVKQDPVNSNRVAIEMVNIVEGMRYRGSAPGIPLDFNVGVTTFNVIGRFQQALNNPTCLLGNCRVVVYNTGATLGGAIPADNPAPGANVYSTAVAPSCSTGSCLPTPGSTNVSPINTSVILSNPGTDGLVTFSTAVLFGLPSPRQRLQIIDTPITYICDKTPGVQSITRYWGYDITSVQPTDPNNSPLNTAQKAKITDSITTCSFNYSSAAAQNNGMITINITLSNPLGEIINLVRQITVNNTP